MHGRDRPPHDAADIGRGERGAIAVRAARLGAGSLMRRWRVALQPGAVRHAQRNRTRPGTSANIARRRVVAALTKRYIVAHIRRRAPRLTPVASGSTSDQSEAHYHSRDSTIHDSPPCGIPQVFSGQPRTERLGLLPADGLPFCTLSSQPQVRPPLQPPPRVASLFALLFCKGRDHGQYGMGRPAGRCGRSAGAAVGSRGLRARLSFHRRPGRTAGERQRLAGRCEAPGAIRSDDSGG
jgi:hypothetical protein